MTSISDAKHVVLQAKNILEGMEVASQVDRSMFVSICTTVSRRFVTERRGKYQVPLSRMDEEVLMRMLQKEVDSLPASVLRKSPDRTGPSVLPAKQVKVAEAVKAVLDKPYRAGNLSRDLFSGFVVAVTKDFVNEWKPSGSQAGRELTDEEVSWITRRTHDYLAAENISTSVPTEPSRPAAAQSCDISPNENSKERSASSHQESPEKNKTFEEELAKARKYTNEMSSNKDGSASERQIKRVHLVKDIAELQQQLTALQATMQTKVEELTQLEGME